MAPKSKSRLVDQPPSASSSEEQLEQVEESQEEEQSEEDSGEETEEDEPKTIEKKGTTQKPAQTPQKTQSSSESGTENGSGSESESEAESGRSQPSPSVSDFTVKPSLPAKSAPSKPPAKRPQETQKEKESRKKKPKIAEEEEKKAAATPRSLWSDDDQVALLKGIVEYKAQKGNEPNADMAAFHEFIKGRLQADVSKSQLSDKLRRLKKKFFTNLNDGEDPVFSKPHDHLVFEYSKKIWGAPVNVKADGGTNNGVKENVNNSTNDKAKKSVAVKKSAEPKKSAKSSSVTKTNDDEKHKEEEKEKQVAVKEVVKEDITKGGDQQNFHLRFPRLAASFESMGGMSALYQNATSYLKENMSLIASDKAKALEEKWKKLHDDEAALLAKRLDLIAEHYRLVVDAMNGN